MNSCPVVIPLSDQVLADQEIRDMIDELIASMYVPVRVVEPKSYVDASTQAGYSCPRCDVAYVSRSGMYQHNKRVHPRFPFTCAICRAGYNRLGALKNHLSTIHKV